jgi:hypothetical protein
MKGHDPGADRRREMVMLGKPDLEDAHAEQKWPTNKLAHSE